MSKSDYFCGSSLGDKNISTDSLFLGLKDKSKPFSNTKCRQRDEAEREHLKEVWSVQQVPKKFEGLSKPSVIVEKLLFIRKSEHETAVKHLQRELDDLRKTYEMEINGLRKNLQNEIDQIRAEVEIKKKSFCELSCLKGEDYQKLKNEINILMTQERSAIDETFELINSVESKTQSDAVLVFKKHNDVLRELFYLQPCELNKLMEKKIMEYNQTTLSNYKRYEDLKLKLRLSADAFKKNYCVWLKRTRKDRKAVCRKSALHDFNVEREKLKNAGSEYLRSMEGTAALCRLKSRKTVISETIGQWVVSVPYPESRLLQQSEQLDVVISSLDSTIGGFIDSYNCHMSRRAGRLLKKLDRLKAIMGTDFDGDDECRAAEESCSRAKEAIDDFVLELKSIWSRDIKMINERATEALKPFRDFGSPWDKQSLSFVNLQEKVALQLQSRAATNALGHGDLLNKVGAEVDTLRQEENVPKLEKRLVVVLSILDQKSRKYQNDFNEDVKIIKKSKELVKKELSAMQSKIDKFLQANDNEPTKVVSETSSRGSSCDSMEDGYLCDEVNLEELIVRELRLVGRQVESLDRWKTGFASRLLKNISSCQSFFENDFAQVVEKWQEELIDDASLGLKGDLEAVEKMREDIRENTYETRLHELEQHQQQLEKHNKMIVGLISESSKCAADFLRFTDVSEEYNIRALQMLEEYGSKIKHSSQTKCLRNMLKGLKEKYKGKVELRVDGVVKRMTRKICMMKRSNEAFVDAITLFADGGNYSKEELKKAQTGMGVLLKKIQKDESEGRQKIKKAQDLANAQMNGIEKSYFESLSVTERKLKLLEDVDRAMVKCEHLVEMKTKELIDADDRIREEIVRFTEKCYDRLPHDEITALLDRLANKVKQAFHFVQGPFPSVNIPKNLSETMNTVRNNTTKQKNPKKQKHEVPQVVDSNIIEYDKDNFASSVVKFVRDALSVINSKGMDFYSTLKNKKEHLSFPDKNKICEESFDSALGRLNTLCDTVFNFWTLEAKRILDFVRTLEMPSLEWYLEDEVESNEEEQSVKTTTTSESDINVYVSTKIDNTFTEFQNTLQEMLKLLQSKYTSYENSDVEKSLKENTISN
ncbi:uncharacterized protein LOC106642290 [Copidosoma floridanum]|uniref:uncharacterized protein LOC106642290 n=1 Tax=Copidosoma floridanum TaxID=29053 RepID=UPI000C6FB350|nr:uncharacterized protein LOC106642290 [Copidosoma floridanum]